MAKPRVSPASRVVLSAALLSLVLVSGGARGASPLPGITITASKPVVIFLLDRTGSMGNCDAAPSGGLVPTTHLRLNTLSPQPAGTSGHFLYDPREFGNDDNPNSGAINYRCEAGAADPLLDLNNRGAHNTDSATPFQITRWEALKLALAEILDADGNGVINAADETELGVEIGVATFGGAAPGGTGGYGVAVNFDDAVISGDPDGGGPGGTAMPDFVTQIHAPIGSDYATAFNAVKNLLSGSNTATGSAYAGIRHEMIAPCYDGSPGTLCMINPAGDEDLDDPASLDPDGAGPQEACRSYYAIMLTDGIPNTDFNTVHRDPVRVAKAFAAKTELIPAVEATPQVAVKTVGIGIGAVSSVLGSKARAMMNCLSFHGGADADKDGDGNALTMADAGGVPAYQGASSIQTRNTVGSISITPPAHLADDIFLLMVLVKDTDAAPSWPTLTVGGLGTWTQFTGSPWDNPDGANPDNRYALYWKRATTAAEGATTVATTTADELFGQIVTFRSAKTAGDPWEVVGATDIGTADNDTLGPSQTTLSANALAVAVAIQGDNETVAGMGGGWVERSDVATGNLSDAAFTIDTKDIVSIGATGTANLDFSNGGQPWGGRILVLSKRPPTSVVITTKCDTNNGAVGNPGFSLNQDSYGPTAALSEPCDANSPYSVCGFGNGYFAEDSTQVAAAIDDVIDNVAVGSYAGSEPTFSVNAGGVVTGNSIFSAFYDVNTSEKERFGHMRKYRFDTAAGDYVDCDDAGTVTGLPVPCWDAGGVMGVSSGGLVVKNESPTYGDTNDGTYAVPGAQPANYLGGLSERNWLSRRIFLPNPAVVTVSGGYYDRDEYKDMTRRPDPASSARTVAPLVPSLSPLPLVLTLADVTLLPATPRSNLEAWLAWGTKESASGGIDTAKTYVPSDYPMALPAMQETMMNLMFAAGKPTATFSDGSPRCGSGCLSDNTFSPKFGYPNRTRPIVVGPPAAFSTDASYIGTPGVDDSGFLQTLLTNPYTGNDAVIERDEAYSYGLSYDPTSVVPAGPCGEGFSGVDTNSDGDTSDPGESTCKVKFRRKVVYVAGNDGAVHAFDEPTGHELWAFIPPGALRRLKLARDGGQVSLLDGTATVRDIRFPNITGDRMADGKWHTVMIYSVGMGGRYYFALDITNPVNPVFLWENFDDEIGYTVARPAIAELPNGAFNASEPGSIVVATGGMLPAGEGSRNSIVSFIRPWDGVRQGHEHSPREDLADSETAIPIQNGATGEPRAVDANNDGKTDRVYFGDVEGRMWKICNITAQGSSAGYHLFFDPGAYDDPHGTGPGYPDTPGSNGDDATPLGTLADKAQRMQLRGPISFPPDISHDGSGNLLVAFGSGNIFDVLTPPTSYKNFVWVVEDSEAGGGTATCAPPTVSACSGNAGLNTVTITTPTNRVFNNVLYLDELLTGPPQILAGFLVYPEFKRTATSTCDGSSYLSRVNARDVFTCGPAASTAFTDPNSGTPNVITYTDSLVTGLQVDPSSGLLFLQTSTGTAPPQAVAAPGLASQTNNLGFRQVY